MILDTSKSGCGLKIEKNVWTFLEHVFKVFQGSVVNIASYLPRSCHGLLAGRAQVGWQGDLRDAFAAKGWHQGPVIEFSALYAVWLPVACQNCKQPWPCRKALDFFWEILATLTRSRVGGWKCSWSWKSRRMILYSRGFKRIYALYL